MAFAISTLAFADSSEEAELLPQLHAMGIGAIEVAPTKRWPAWVGADQDGAVCYRQALDAININVCALQAIVFGRPELTLFGADFSPWLPHFERLSMLAATLGARSLILGAPGQRDPGSSSDPDTIAADRLRQLAAVCAPKHITVAVEPVPSARFVRTLSDAQLLAERVAHPQFGWHLDASAWAASGEDLSQVLRRSLPQHVHLSQPALRGPGDGPIDFVGLVDALRSAGYIGDFSFEILHGAHTWAATLPQLATLLARLNRAA